MSSAEQYFRFFPDAWDDGTAELTLEQQAGYMRILNQMYRRGGPILGDPVSVMAYIRCHRNKAMAILKALVDAGKIEIRPDGRLFNGRAAIEIEHRRKVTEARINAGAKGGRPTHKPADVTPLTPPQVLGGVCGGVEGGVEGEVRPEKPNETAVSENQLVAHKIRVDKKESPSSLRSEGPEPPGSHLTLVVPDPKTRLYSRGIEVLGTGSGGLVTKLLRSKGNSIGRAMAVLEFASDFSDHRRSREYVNGAISAQRRSAQKLDVHYEDLTPDEQEKARLAF